MNKQMDSDKNLLAGWQSFASCCFVPAKINQRLSIAKVGMKKN
jgi:hypothetical protein